MNLDHILLIGFGGPRAPDEVPIFLRQVTSGRNIPESRFREVCRHYEEIGGRSPYNTRVFHFWERLKRHAALSHLTIPIYTGMRNWHPFLKDALLSIKKSGLKRGIGIVLAPHRSEASYERYLESLNQARIESDATNLEYHFLKSWHEHPLFIEAHTDQLKKTLSTLGDLTPQSTHILFTAHSIPLQMASSSSYAQEIHSSSAKVMELLGSTFPWSIGYQSRSGSPSEPWLGPPAEECLKTLRAKGISQVVTLPIGFLCDNAETLFDLDIELRSKAEQSGMKYARVPTVLEHESIVAMFFELIQDAISRADEICS